MKKITMSLVAIALATTAAQADIKNESFGGSASLFYGTNDANDGDLFDKGTSYGNVGIQLGGTASVGACDTCVKLNYGVTGVSTMGLEDTLVSDTWAGQTIGFNDPKLSFPLGKGKGVNINDGVWIDTLNLSFQPLSGISNTTMVLGRQALDTPMVFTETWNIAKNTYDAAVAVNNDIVDTTLVAAWVGRSNGKDFLDKSKTALSYTGFMGDDNAPGTNVYSDGISDNAFNRFLTDEGAYAFGAVTKAIPGIAAQAWYYIAPGAANVAWLQADGSYEGFGLGAQYVYTDPSAGDTGSGYAVKIGYNYEGLGLSAAYSDTDKDLLTAANLGGTQSKLYTEAWWNYGYVSAADVTAYNVSATYNVKDVASFGVYYTDADKAGGDAGDLTEIAVTAGKDLGNLNLTLAYVNSDGTTDDNKKVDQNDIQVYATYKF